MPTKDNLTQRLKADLAKRGIAVSDEQIQERVQSFAYEKNPHLFAQPNDRKQAQSSSMLNAIGVGLWSALDTAAFGIPGAFIDEEEYLDFSSTSAKWTGAIGGMAGFIAGAPVKLGAKAVQMLARPAIKSLGKQALGTVTKDMSRRAIKEGISRKASRDIIKRYKSLTHRAQVDKNLATSDVWKKSVTDLMDDYIGNATRLGQISAKEGVAIKKMFGDNVYTRPLQDFIGVMMNRGMAKTNPKLAKVVGHAINDALMFGMIDTVFEGVSTIEDHEFDWTAPIWGVVNGVAFSQLSWLKPRGKASKWLPDFRAGIRSVFAKNPYGNMTKEQLIVSAQFYGDLGNKVRTIAGKDINLTSKDLAGELQAKFGDKTASVLRDFLDSERKTYGKAIMRWATTDTVENIQKNWMRMAMGGILFNTHTFAEMFLHDYEPTLDDILPHFFIGAFMQMGKNPRRFDLEGSKINQLRLNLSRLGFNTGQLHSVPSFNEVQSRFSNPLNGEKQRSVLNMAEAEGIGSNKADVSGTLPAGETSVLVQRNTKFSLLHKWLKLRFKFMANEDAISTKQAERIVAEFEKNNFAGKKKVTLEDYENMFERLSVESSENLEREFPLMVEQFKRADDRLETKNLEIEQDTNSGVFRAPSYVVVDTKIIRQAREGKLEWLKSDDGEILSGETAVEKLLLTVEGGYTGIRLGAELSESLKINPVKKERVLTSEELVRSMYETIEGSERRINEEFPNEISYADKFSYGGSIDDYVSIVGHNAAVKAGIKVVDIFSVENSDIRGDLSSRLREAGLLKGDVLNIGDNLLIDSVEKIEIIFPDTVPTDVRAEKEASLKRTLGRILTLQAHSGGYGRYTNTGKVQVEEGSVESLISFLKEKKLPIDTMSDVFHSNLASFILRDAIKKSNISLTEAESIFNLAELGFGGFGTGEAGGFHINLIDEAYVSDTARFDAKQYNILARNIINKSNGLVSRGQTIKIAGGDVEASTLHSTLANSSRSVDSARTALEGFVNSIGSGVLQNQIGTYITASYGGADKLRTWLIQTGVLEVKKGRYEYVVNMEKFTDEIQANLKTYINRQGYASKYLEAKYENEAQIARDILTDNNFLLESDYKFTLNNFFAEYLIDGVNYAEESPSIGRNALFELLYVSPTKKGLSQIAIPKVLMSLSVKDSNGEYVKWRNIKDRRVRDKHTKRITRELLGIVGGINNQHRINIIKVENNSITQNEGFRQKTKLNVLLEDEIGLPVSYVDTMGVVYIQGWNGQFRKQYVNLFGDSTNLPKAERERIQDAKSNLTTGLNRLSELDGVSVGELDGTRGVVLMQLSKDVAPIVIARKDLPLIVEKFKKTAALIEKSGGINEKVRKNTRELNERLQKDVVTDTDYQLALTKILFTEMFSEKGKASSKLIDFFNDGSIDNSMGRVKLYDNKNFIKYDRQTVASYMHTYGAILGDKRTENALGKIFQQNGFNVAIWNDEGRSVASVVEEAAQLAGMDVANLRNIIGRAHHGVSAFDSIGFVSKSQMRVMQALLGNDPNSKNPIKPAISSGGDDVLLYGKTLLVYGEGLEQFFNTNSSVDILLSSSAAKAFNKGKVRYGLDVSIINQPISRLNSARPIGQQKIRLVPIEALGLKQKIDKKAQSPVESLADYNFMTNAENGKIYEQSGYSSDVTSALAAMERLSETPERLRHFVLSAIGQEGLPVGDGALAKMNSLVYFAQQTQDANVMSFSPTQVKNRMYSNFMHAILHGRRGQLNDGTRIGGQASLIQTIEHRLMPTIMDAEGKMLQRGEIMLSHEDRLLSITKIIEAGNELVFTKGSKTLTGDEVFGKEIWNELISSKINLDLETLHEAVKYEDNALSVGVVVNKKPRTRPNDFAILSLKGFLSKNYGKSIQINSFDVVNIFEGDYDADIADYFIGHRKAMMDHVKRTQKLFVQGVDPASFQAGSDFSWKDNPSTIISKIENMAASSDLAKQAIGSVQRVPSMLQYLSNIAEVRSEDVVIRNLAKIEGLKKSETPSVLFHTPDGGRIIMEYDHADYYTRAALEAQYMIDIQGQMDASLARDVREWGSKFLFPSKEEGITFRDMKKQGISHINNMRTTKKISKRVKIFSYVNEEGIRDTREVTEVEQAMIQTLMSEYGKFLNISGEKTYSTEGKESTIGYDDVFSGTKAFVDWHTKLSNNLYYTLRRRKTAQGVPFFQDGTFKGYFDIKEGSYEKGEYVNNTYQKVKKKYWAPGRDIFMETDVARHVGELRKGERGTIANRALVKFYMTDVFGDSKVKNKQGLRFGEIGSIDEWYSSMVRGDEIDVDRVQIEILKNASNFNKAVASIASLKKKIVLLQYQKNLSFRGKNAIKAKLNKVIDGLEFELKKYTNEDDKYWETKKVKDLTKYKFTPIEGRDVLEAQIQHSTMKWVLERVPGKLTSGGQEDLNFLKQIRKEFYSNNGNLKDIFKYGSKSILESSQIKYLERMPTLSEYYEIEGNLLARGIARHGIRFLWEFMAPPTNRNQIGVFNGRLAPMPYGKSARYKRGMQVLTGIAQGRYNEISVGDGLTASLFDVGDAREANKNLRILQTAHSQYERFFNKRTEWRKTDAIDLGDGIMLHPEEFQLPAFSSELTRPIGAFEDIKWAKDVRKQSYNDNMVEFYNNVIRAKYGDSSTIAGFHPKMEKYLNITNELKQQMMSNGHIDPIKYLATKATLEKELKQIMTDVLTGGIGENGDKIAYQKLLSSPTFILMGGSQLSGHQEGMSFENKFNYNLKEVREQVKISKELEDWEKSSAARARNGMDEIRANIEACSV